MPRNHATEYVDRIGELDLEPVDAVAEYLTSKENDKIFLKPPAIGSTTEDLQSFYVYEKIQHQNVMKQLHAFQEDRKLQKMILNHRISKAAKDIAILRASSVDINVIARDLNERKKSSHKKIVQERQKQKFFLAEIDDKQEKYEALKKFKKVFQTNCDEYAIYEDVLNSAVKISGELSIHDLTSRCDAMMITQTEIDEMNKKQMQSIVAMKNKMLAIIKNTELVYLGLKTELDQMNHFYRMACQDCLRWEKIYLKANEAVVRINLDKGMARESINQLYSLLCRRKGIIPIYRRSQVEQCLKFIMSETKLMQDILEECNNPTMPTNTKKDICSIAK